MLKNSLGVGGFTKEVKPEVPKNAWGAGGMGFYKRSWSGISEQLDVLQRKLDNQFLKYEPAEWRFTKVVAPEVRGGFRLDGAGWADEEITYGSGIKFPMGWGFGPPNMFARGAHLLK